MVSTNRGVVGVTLENGMVVTDTDGQNNHEFRNEKTAKREALLLLLLLLLFALRMLWRVLMPVVEGAT
jgi:hypothetical protein